jgi:uncharacterized membrane protein YkvA (DUF1232 family)
MGYIDDFILIPIGIFMVLKMIPQEVLEECREKAESEAIGGKLKIVVMFIIVLIWLLVAYLVLKSYPFNLKNMKER